MIHIVDTHSLVWYLEDSPKLGGAGRTLFSDPGAQFLVPTIVLAEAQSLESGGRTSVSWDEIVAAVEADRRFEIFPLTLDVLRRMPRRSRLEMHDAIICATALVSRDELAQDVAVITRDQQIIASGVVETIW